MAAIDGLRHSCAIIWHILTLMPRLACQDVPPWLALAKHISMLSAGKGMSVFKMPRGVKWEPHWEETKQRSLDEHIVTHCIYEQIRQGGGSPILEYMVQFQPVPEKKRFADLAVRPYIV